LSISNTNYFTFIALSKAKKNARIKSKVLKEVKLVDELLKYQQSRVYVSQGRLRMWVVKEACDNPIAGHIGGNATIYVCRMTTAFW
jgi:hypothetical protein